MADKKPEQEREETPAESPAEEKTSENEIAETVEESATQPQSEEEVAWNNLSGKSQDRFRKMIEERDRVKEELDRLQNLRAEQAQKDYQAVSTPDQEVQQAIYRLRQGGMATQEDVQTIANQIRKDQIHSKLELKYSGGKLPEYDKVVVEDYAKRHGFGDNYEAAFKDMYFDEFVDQERRRRRTTSPTSAKPTASTKEEPMTVDKMRQMFREDPQGAYTKLVSKDPRAFDKLLKELSTE